MNLTDYVRILLRRGWIILLAVVLTTGSGFVLSKLQTPVYRATQKVLIKPARADFGLTQTLKQLISSWQSRLDTELRAQDAIDALHLDMTAAQLHSMVTITADLNNLLLTVDVDMKDGAVAEQVAEHGQLQKALDIVGAAHDIRVEIFQREQDDPAEQDTEQRTRCHVDLRIGAQ